MTWADFYALILGVWVGCGMILIIEKFIIKKGD